MKKLGECDLSKMSDSRIMYMRQPPNFLLIFVIFIIILLMSIVVWSNIAVKAETVETSGLIVSEDKTPITIETDGTIASIQFEEGEYVNKGDLIFSIDKTQMQNQMEKYEYMRDYYKERIGYINVFLRELNKEKMNLPYYTPHNPFYDEGKELEFYNLFDTYYQELEANNFSITIIENKESGLVTEKNSCESELISNENSVQEYQILLKKYDLIAPISGNIHYDYTLRVGTVVKSGTELGSVSSHLGDKKIEMYIDASNRAKISVGNRCYFTVNGLAQTEFGTADGVIESISSDAILSDDKIYFKVMVAFKADHLTSSKGTDVEIVNGMKVNLWTVFEEMTYWNYFMEQIGLYPLGTGV